MPDIIALAAALSFLLAACATAIPEGNNASRAPPAVSGNPSASKDTAADVTASAEPSPEVRYPEYTLTYTSGGAPLYPGIQSGTYPWSLALVPAYRIPHTSGDMPGTVFYRVNGDGYRLFYRHIEESGKDVLSAFMTTLDPYETARGIARGDTVDELLEAYDDGLLWQPEPFPVSRDLGGDFCVYDELFVYTRPEDDNCCLVFYVASDITSKFITGIQISLGQDGGPSFSAGTDNTFAVNYNDIDQYLKTDTSDEEHIHQLFGAEGPVSPPDFLDALAGINWRIYSQLYPEDTRDLIDWLYLQTFTADHDILCVLKATKGLDGGVSEGYAGVLANIYRNDSRQFIRLAAELDDAQIAGVAHLACFDLVFNKTQVINELEGYRSTGGLTEKELLVIDEILYCFKTWYTDS
jgi:hypothetical protein